MNMSEMSKKRDAVTKQINKIINDFVQEMRGITDPSFRLKITIDETNQLSFAAEDNYVYDITIDMYVR